MPTLSAAFAFADVMVEATRRGLRRGTRTTMVEEAQAASSGQLFVILGRDLRCHLERMVAADDRYQELRARQRVLRRRRDSTAKHAYRGLVTARNILKGLLGYDGARDYLGLRGPTEREPNDLHLQIGEAVWWARNHESEIEPLDVRVEAGVESCIARLEQLHSELNQVLSQILRGDREIEAAMFEQRVAMTAFDHAYKHTAGTIEARLIEVGLPTLATTVRPGIGRRGRPLKQRPVDRYPDLVEQVRVQGLIELDQEASTGDWTEAEAVASSPTVSGDGSERPEKSQQPLLERSGGEAIIAQPLHKHSRGERIIEQPFHKHFEGEEKSLHLFHKRLGEDSKIEQPFHKLSVVGSSGVTSRLTQSPPVLACSQDPRRRDLTHRSDRVEQRSRRPVAGSSPIKQIRRAASSWWERVARSA